MDLAAACSGFDLGSLVEVESVLGGRSNEMWHVWTERGEYAVKAMVVNADQPDFVSNLEAAFAVESRACLAGVPMPEPVAVPGSGRCLRLVDGRLTRAHAWVEATAANAVVYRREAGRLIAAVHAASPASEVALDDEPWTVAQWRELSQQSADRLLAQRIHDSADLLARLEAMTSDGPGTVPTVDSHRDFDPKNALVGSGGLLAVDWDAAGPVSVAREVVQVALDWSTSPAGFAEVIDAYRSRRPEGVPAEPWVFGGWVSAHAGWLLYNVANRASTPHGVAEASASLARLQALSAHLATYLRAV
jgi:Phosphotransferase enzyme family